LPAADWVTLTMQLPEESDVTTPVTETEQTSGVVEV
jgi:hypothetical protein